MKKLTLIITVIVLVAAVVSAGYLLFNKPSEKFPPIEKCVIGVNVDYTSNIKVSNLEDVKTVFNKYIESSKNRNESIFGYGNNWRFDYAKIDGKYESKNYWAVTASRLVDGPEDSNFNKWLPQEIFDVSEDGEVVRLLGCT